MRDGNSMTVAAAIAATVCFTGAAYADGPRRPVPRSVSASYFGELFTHPGVAVGGEHEITGRGGHSLFGGASLAVYDHRGFHVGVLGSVELGYRYTFEGGFFGDARVGAGYLHTILGGDTYAPSGDGGFAQVSAAARGAFAPSAAVSLGYDLSRRTAAPVSVFARLTAFGQAPVNDRAVLHLAAQLGVAIHFDR
jgi:hypothetical protein